MEVKDETKGGPHFVGKKDELIAAKRSFRTLDGRDIMILYHQGVLYAMDMYCYRESFSHRNLWQMPSLTNKVKTDLLQVNNWSLEAFI